MRVAVIHRPKNEAPMEAVPMMMEALGRCTAFMDVEVMPVVQPSA